MKKVSELKASLTDMLIDVENSTGLGTRDDYGELRLYSMIPNTSDVVKLRDELIKWMVDNGLLEDDGV